MFCKLLKHEWKDNSKLLWILTACVAGIAVLATVLMRIFFPMLLQMEESENLFFFAMPVLALFLVAYFSILAYSIVVHYVMLFRFYKNRFTDRGYLMFTLPVKTHYHFTVPAVHMLLWSLLSLLVTVACASLLMFVGFDWNTITGGEDVIREIFSIFEIFFSDSFATGYLATLIVTGIVDLVSSIVIPMACVSVASVIAKKHKILVSIGLIYGVSMVMGIIQYVISMIPMMMLFAGTGNDEVTMILVQVCSWIMPVILTVVGYVLSVKLMKKKLNLP